MAYNIGSMVRYNKSDHFAFTLSADYFTTNPEFTELGAELVISNISLGIGIAYRLK